MSRAGLVIVGLGRRDAPLTTVPVLLAAVDREGERLRRDSEGEVMKLAAESPRSFRPGFTDRPA